MKALRTLRNLPAFSIQPQQKTQFNPSFLCRFFSAQTQLDHPTTSTTTSSSSENEIDVESSVFDSAQFTIPSQNPQKSTQNGGPTWDGRYRERTKRIVFREEPIKEKMSVVEEQEGREEEERERALARALLRAALDGPDEEDEEEEEEVLINVEDQKSLSVGIIGAPNAGKSALTNYMVGTKVAAVSRKTNTTTHEGLGVMTKGDTQICFFDTPGLMLKKSGFPSRDVKARIELA